MSLKSDGIPLISPETIRIARAACPDGTFAIHLRDLIGTVYTDVAWLRDIPIASTPRSPLTRIA